MNRKHVILIAVLSLLLGAAISWRITSMRARHNLIFFLHGLAKTEIYTQERATSTAYLTQSPEVAAWALIQLNRTYSRYAEVPTRYQDEWRTHLRQSSALAYARLADIYSQQGREEKRRSAIENALALGSYEDEEHLVKNMKCLNELERKQLRQPTPQKTPEDSRP